MKNLYSKTGEKWLNSVRNGFAFHNIHTELLAIWTVLFMIITGLFVLAIQSNILVMLLLFISAVVIMFIGTFAAIYYLHALKYQNQKRLLPGIHKLFNKSFKLRSIFRWINPAPFFHGIFNPKRKRTTSPTQQIVRF
ncbi:MAG: hypothetical protein HW400_849 [Candidatus Levybacteria bacterium]|nr:hypothetical protein [Candidatus Levybacteria bacterium]